MIRRRSIGTLVSQGYPQVETAGRGRAGASTTPAAFATRPSRKSSTGCNSSRRAGKGKMFAVLGCVAQQEGEKIFEKAPHVSLVCGSASYTSLPRDAGAARNRQPARHRAEPGYRRDLRDAVHAPRQSAPRLHHHHRRLRQDRAPIAWCRSRAGRSAAAPAPACSKKRAGWRTRATPRSSCWGRTSTATAILARGLGFRHAARRASGQCPASAACASPLRIRAISSRAIVDAIDANPALCNHVHLPVQSGSTPLLAPCSASTRAKNTCERIEWMKSARRHIAITTDIIVGFPGETEADFEDTLGLLDEVEYDSIFSFKYSRRPNTPALAMDDQIPEEEKTRRSDDRAGEAARDSDPPQRRACRQRARNAWWKGLNKAPGQWIGRTSQNRR